MMKDLFAKIGFGAPVVATAEPVATKVPEPVPEIMETILRFPLTVPEGYVMPCGTPITQPFALTVEAGARWHPEWTEPMVTVNAWRFLPLGDALGWSGEKVLAFDLPAEVSALVPFHGQPLTDESRKALADAGLTVPVAVETLASFHAKPITTSIH